MLFSSTTRSKSARLSFVWRNTSSTRENPALDIAKPNIARVYDYWLGGKDNFAADRDEAERLLQVYPLLRAKAREAAEVLTKRPAGSLNQTKALMRDMDKIAAQISREGALFRERLQTGEAREAFAAFAERRKPDFSKVAG